MGIQDKVLKLFVLWLFSVALVAVTYSLYFGELGAEFIQTLSLAAILMLSILYLGVRAIRLGKNFFTIVGVGWLLGVYVYVGLIRASMEARQGLLILVGISIFLNLALSVLIKKKAPH